MIVGIDPGLSGAAALISDTKNLIEVCDMPVMAATKKRNQVNAAELTKILSRWKSMYPDITAFIEQASAMPGQGVSSMFGFGESYGVIFGVCAALEIPVQVVPPHVWKKGAGLIGKDKDLARTKAQQLYPQAELGRKKDIGRADAILIARYGVN